MCNSIWPGINNLRWRRNSLYSYNSPDIFGFFYPWRETMPGYNIYTWGVILIIYHPVCRFSCNMIHSPREQCPVQSVLFPFMMDWFSWCCRSCSAVCWPPSNIPSKSISCPWLDREAARYSCFLSSLTWPLICPDTIYRNRVSSLATRKWAIKSSCIWI